MGNLVGAAVRNYVETIVGALGNLVGAVGIFVGNLVGASVGNFVGNSTGAGRNLVGYFVEAVSNFVWNFAGR